MDIKRGREEGKGEVDLRGNTRAVTLALFSVYLALEPAEGKKEGRATSGLPQFTILKFPHGTTLIGRSKWEGRTAGGVAGFRADCLGPGYELRPGERSTGERKRRLKRNKKSDGARVREERKGCRERGRGEEKERCR